jgi:hypothetical protein
MRLLPLALALALTALAPAHAAKAPEKEKPPKAEKPPKGKRPKATAVEHLATLPAPAGVGANFKRYADGRTYMFVSTLSGLYVYDVTAAASPTPVGALPLPHFQNEDVSLGGDRLLISTDGGVGGGYLLEIDISNPATPVPVRAIKMEPAGEGHTASCIDPACRWVWVAGDQVTPGINVFDLEKPAQLDAGAVRADNDPGLWTFGFVPIPASEASVGTIGRDRFREFGWSTHDVHVDEAGVAWVAGGDGTIGFDVANYGAEGTDPLDPPVVARTGDAALNDNDSFDGPAFGNMEGFDPENARDTVNDFVHHNALRPDGGDTVLITEEDLYNRRVSNMPGGCEVQGSFQTWGVAGGELKPLDSWKTEFNELLADTDQDPWGGDIVPTMGLCSAHYFDERDGLVAVAWYEQGVRLLDVDDPTNIEQVGYWVPPGGATWSTYWAPTAKDILYVIDNKRGVDVLRVKRGEKPAVEAPILPSWTAGTRSFGKSYPGLGWICRVR